MKYFIQVWMVIVFTFNLPATNQYDDDVIVPEYFSSDKTSSIIEEEIIMPESTSIIEEQIASTNDIVPESFTNNNEVFIANSITTITQEEPISSTSSLNMIDNDTDIPDQNYAGYYSLFKGSTELGGNFQQLDYGFLVIEKLDENDFGFYYVIQKGDSAPNNRYGIFHYKEGKFFQKFLDNSPLRDNIKVLKSGIDLSTMITGNLGEYNLHWQEVSADDINSLSSKLQKYLKDTKENYRQIYKEKFTN